MRRATPVAASALLGAALLIAGSSCDLFGSDRPYSIAVEQPRDGDTLFVGEPFRVEARLEGDYPIERADIGVYSDLGTRSKDTLLQVPIPVPPDAGKTLRIDTTLTIERFYPAARVFVLHAKVSLGRHGAGGTGPRVTVIDSNQ